MAKTQLVGVISDTHGLIRPQALEALRGCDLIIHAGDVGRPEVLGALQALAPVFAVRGNVDRGLWAERLPLTEVVQASEALLYIYHGHHELELDPAAARFQGVISGHSHRVALSTQDGVLYLNPGSAGPRRFSLPVTLARLAVTGRNLEPEIIKLPV